MHQTHTHILPEPWQAGLHDQPLPLLNRDYDIYVMDQHPEIQKPANAQGNIYVIPIKITPLELKKMYHNALGRSEDLKKVDNDAEMKELGEFSLFWPVFTPNHPSRLFEDWGGRFHCY